MNEDIENLEKELHDPSVRRNPERLNQLLHDSFLEIGRSGEVYDKAQILNSINTEPVHTVWSDGYTSQKISDGVVLLTYRTAHIGLDNELSRFTLRSSLWEKAGSSWQLRFHQGTPTEKV